eukprot:161473-Chlamydomonas_euryale.AAC.1
MSCLELELLAAAQVVSDVVSGVVFGVAAVSGIAAAAVYLSRRTAVPGGASGPASGVTFSPLSRSDPSDDPPGGGGGGVRAAAPKGAPGGSTAGGRLQFAQRPMESIEDLLAHSRALDLDFEPDLDAAGVGVGAGAGAGAHGDVED